VLVGYGPRTTEAKRRPRKASAVPPAPAAAAAQQSVQSAFSTAADKPPETALADAQPEAVPAEADPAQQPVEALPVRGRALAKPPVRKLAKDLGIDLAAVAPTGDGGIVTRADVEAVAAGGTAAPGSDGAGTENRIGGRPAYR
jgi:pyruvate dehydrogenase E2 component (dihydrolipoamide acetyltransferase)